jgi:hypothetical protein
MYKNNCNNYAENIRNQPTKFSPLDDKVAGTCASLIPLLLLVFIINSSSIIINNNNNNNNNNNFHISVKFVRYV